MSICKLMIASLSLNSVLAILILCSIKVQLVDKKYDKFFYN